MEIANYTADSSEAVVVPLELCSWYTIVDHVTCMCVIEAVNSKCPRGQNVVIPQGTHQNKF